jgi:hypothetical protein
MIQVKDCIQSYSINDQDAIHTLLQKPFVVTVSNTFIVSVEITDTICPMRKTASL